jgi:uncharacterized membrane protein
MLAIHITAGLIALLTGAVALAVTKGGRVHRRFGTAFAVAMLAMASTGAVMAIYLRPNPANMMGGILTCYLVATGALTFRSAYVASARAMTASLLVAAIASASCLILGVVAIRMGGAIDGIPSPPIFMFAVVAGLAAIGDARVLRAGGIAGSARLRRHLWRMGFAMFVATGSFFLGQAKLFPDALRKPMLLAIPVLLVLATMAYWLVRVRWWRPRAA